MPTVKKQTKSQVVKLTTLTPLWTGGVSGQMDRVHETGIIGSMRWWYEAIIRGLGGFACDPTEHNEKDEQNCQVAKYYGRNGWRRQFRLDGRSTDGCELYPGNVRIPSGRNRGWFLGSGLHCNLDLHITQTSCPVLTEKEELVPLAWALPLRLMHYWGALGAKTQHGYGVVEIHDVDKLPFLDDKSTRLLFGDLSKTQRNQMALLPNLKYMFFSKIAFQGDQDWWEDTITFKNAHSELRKVFRKSASYKRPSVPVSPIFRNWLRYNYIGPHPTSGRSPIDFGKKPYGQAEQEVFGCLRPTRRRTRLNISSAYKVDNRWAIRIWGWLPKSKNYDREKVLKSLKKLLQETRWSTGLIGPTINSPELLVWREFRSARDTVRFIDNPTDFLISLANGEVKP